MVFFRYSLRQFVSDSLVTIVITAMLTTVSAQVMTSSNYTIQSDSVNVGGGLSTSSSFTMESTTGELATGNSTSSSYTLLAGYQQMHEVYMALNAIADVILLPNLPGITGGNATGSTAVHVTTDSAAGYQMTISAENSPAMQSGVGTIADYTTGTSGASFLFVTNPTDVHFGFSPEGPDIIGTYRDTGGVCGGGTDTADRCWDGLSTSSKVIAQSTGSNHPAGATTTLKFQVGIGGSVAVIEGLYTATSTITVLPL